MEQLYNAMMASVQIPQAAPTVQKSESSGKDDFQKLLEQKQGADTASSRPKQEDSPEAAQKPEEPQETAGKTQEAQEPQQIQTAPKSEKELEDQMALAAIAMMQNPVVPAEQVLTPEEENVVVSVEGEEIALAEAGWEVEQFTESAAGKPVFQEQQIAAPEEKDSAETQAPVEEILQAAIKTPEAVQETEERTVEVKVETGDASQEAETEDSPELQDAEAEAPVFKDVETVPVKVGEAPKTEKPQEPVETQIGNRLTQALANGETRVELQLNPENLGKVMVEMTWSEKGGLVVQLHAENHETQNLLTKNLSGLEALLGRETQQEVRVEVPRQEESQRQDLYEQQQNHHKQQQEHQEQRRSRQSDSFMQQLRLGLIPMDEE